MGVALKIPGNEIILNMNIIGLCCLSVYRVRSANYVPRIPRTTTYPWPFVSTTNLPRNPFAQANTLGEVSDILVMAVKVLNDRNY